MYIRTVWSGKKPWGYILETSKSHRDKYTKTSGGFHIQGDTATEKLIWAFNQNSNQFLLIFKLIIFDTYPIQLDWLDLLTFMKDFLTPWYNRQGWKWQKSKINCL